jgi:NAD(P)-dependent dehydrogenase (short-subunit alcohol dehydrogenase family)
MGRMDGRRALITGGANGLGAATAKLFAAEGAQVVIADLDSMVDRGVELADEITESGAQASFVAMDVRDVAITRAAVDQAATLMGGIDTVVASAGLGAPPGHTGSFNELLHLDIAAFDAVQEVNVRGVLAVFQRAAQLMVAAGEPGSMVALASMASKRPTAGAYSVSKAAVWMLTRCMAQELGQYGIRVNAIGPGYVETELFDGMARVAAPDGPEAQAAWREGRRAQVTLRRFGEPDDVAQTALFLCSDGGAYFTGSILHPDGGYTSTFGGG